MRRGIIVFVVDASASMRISDVDRGGAPVSRIESAVREIETTLDGLLEGGEFYFDIVICSNRIEVLSSSLGLKGPLVLDGGNLEAAHVFLTGRRGAGMTRLFEAMERAFQISGGGPKSLCPGSVLLYTDGIPTFRRRGAGPRSMEEFFPAVYKVNPGRVRVNAYAVSATSEGTAFLKRLCSENGGILFAP